MSSSSRMSSATRSRKSRKIPRPEEINDQTDLVNYPPHYTFGKHQVIDIIDDLRLDQDYYLGNVVKYLARAGRKSPNALQDLKKAQWYLGRKISKLENLPS